RSTTAPWGRGPPCPSPAAPGAAAARRSRCAARAAPGGSTTSRPGSPAPSRGGTRPGGSAGPGLFFSRVGGVGGGDPVLGAAPADAQTLQGLADGLARQGPGRPALGETGL